MNLDVPLEKLEEDPSVIFALDRDLVLRYCNSSWDRFARENGGEQWLAQHALGSHIMEAVAEPLRPFYERAYATTRDSGQPWEHEYECSSPEKYRIFQMRILPLSGSRGFLAVNSLAVERNHDAPREPAQGYETEAGLITLCCHCRRTARADGSGAWDWVPDHLRIRGAKVSHGLCPTCFSYFYPGLGGARRQSFVLSNERTGDPPPLTP